MISVCCLIKEAIRLRDAVVLPLRLLPIRWPLTVRVALNLRGRRGVCGLLSVAVDVLVTVLGLGGAAVDIDGARATGGMVVLGVLLPP